MMLLWPYSLFLLWETTSVSSVNLAKIDPKIMKEYHTYGWYNIYVWFGSTKPALEAAKRESSSGTLEERAGNVRRHLINLAEMEQAGVMNMLSSRKTNLFERMWVSNRIYINMAKIELIKEISDFANVTYIREEARTLVIDENRHETEETAALRSSNSHHNVTKGLELIQAAEAWKVLGGACKAGEGVMVGVLDSGAFAGHETLYENFVGMDYGYFDGHQEPVVEALDMIHGTHVTGTIVGRNGIGVAPAAKHLQCRASTKNHIFERAFENCIAFFICPTLQNGTEPDCSRRVHVIHLSVGSLDSTIKPIVDAAVSAGILLVAPAGVKWYDSDECREGTYPGLMDEVLAVGVVNFTDQLYRRSPRGPNPDPKGNPKPDVVAPGVDILSAHYKHTVDKYISMTGSLPATAHVTGLVALLLTRDKTLTQDQVRKIIIENTDRPLQSEWGCDNQTQNTWPNPEFGYGRINALKALNAQTLMLTGTNKSQSQVDNTCQQSLDSYKKRFNENLKTINSLIIEIRKDIQRSIEDFKVLAHQIYMFNATLKTLLDKAQQFETSLKALEGN